jgi:hypothetical protein
MDSACKANQVSIDHLKLRLTAVFEPAPEGGFTCHFDELPEVFSEGETVEEAKANLFDVSRRLWNIIARKPERILCPVHFAKNFAWPPREAGRFGAASSRPRLFFVREGGNHPIWKNTVTGKVAPIPRHREIKKGTGACDLPAA